MSQLLVAALTFLLSVATLLGVAAWNRTDRRTLVLTERELPLVVARGGLLGAATSAEVLRFRVQARSAPDESRLWLSDATLRQMGFALGVPAGAPEAAQFYLRALPRQVWVAFEMDGESFVPIARQLALGGTATRRSGAWERLAPSRLVAVDASLRREQLVTRWRERPVLVMQAVVAMRFEQHPSRGPSVWGQMTALVQPTLQVPEHVHRTMERAGWLTEESVVPSQISAASSPRPPRYDVVLGVGRLGSAWVESVRPHAPTP